MIKFNNFLNENVSKRFQYSIYKDDLEDFKKELKEKSDEYNVDVDTSIVNGISQVKILFRFKGEDNDIEELISWIRYFNTLKEDKEYDKAKKTEISNFPHKAKEWENYLKRKKQKEKEKGWQDGMGKPPWLEDEPDSDDDKGGWQDGMGKPPWLE